MPKSSQEVAIGVDPGAVAGWGILTIEAVPKLLHRGKIDFGKARRGEFRTASEMLRWASLNYIIVMVAIEDQYLDPDPKKIASMIKLCRRAGRWEEAACTHNVPFRFVKPSVWQCATFGRGLKRKQLKVISQRVCAQLYRIKANEHIADGCLLGTYEAKEIWLSRRQLSLKRRPRPSVRRPSWHKGAP